MILWYFFWGKQFVKSKTITCLKWSVMIYPCASVESVFNFRPVDIAAGWWTLYSHWYCHSVLALCPQPSAWTQIKKMKHWYHRGTRIGLFTDFFFDLIWSMFFGFHYGFIWIRECWHTPFPGGFSVITPHTAISPHLASPEGEGQIPLAKWF